MHGELVVRGAGFTPVKGMRHLAHDSIDLDAQGVVGDRVYALVDVQRARVLRTVQHPRLVGVVALADGDDLRLTLPGGEEAWGPARPTGEVITCDYWGRQVALELTEGPHAPLVADLLGTTVRLARAPRGGVVFGGPVTLVTTASLEAMDVADEPERFRATLVVDTEEPWVEDTWTGRTFAVGDATVRVGGPVPRCAVVDHHPRTGEKDTRLLARLAAGRPTNRAGEPVLGVYATCVRPGRVTVTR